jgi:hypothetical protein
MVNARNGMLLCPIFSQQKHHIPKKRRKMNDIKACRAVKEPNLGSAESPPRLQLSVKI